MSQLNSLFLSCSLLFLRQSNLAPRTKRTFDSTRHLVRSDVVIEPDAIIINIKWSKTKQGPTASSVAAPSMGEPDLCPVRAFQDMIVHAPGNGPKHPLFAFTDGTPMPLSYINRAWNEALLRLGLPKRQYTLHSLRRGGATSSFVGGAASVDQIMAHGTWSSNAVNCYLPNDPRRSEVYKYFKGTS